MPSVATALPSVSDQAERLIELGVHRIAGRPADRLRNVAGSAGSLLVVVTDMSDVDEFAPISSIKLLQQPDALTRRRCFMTIGSRREPGSDSPRSAAESR
jgi:hypothetical protein